MQDRFLIRLGEMYQAFTTDFMVAEFDKMAAILEPEMPPGTNITEGKKWG